MDFPRLPTQRRVYTLDILKSILTAPNFELQHVERISSDEMTLEAIQYYINYLDSLISSSKKKEKRISRRIRENAKGVTSKAGGKPKKDAFNSRRPYSASNCSICLGKIRKGNKFQTKCNHWYHWSCFRTFITKTDKCAICRGQMLL